MLHSKFQAPEPSSSGEEDFEVYFIIEPRTPRRGAMSNPKGQYSNKLGRGSLGNATYQGPRPTGFTGDVV